MKILFAGGGTGGHIYPIITVAQELKKLYSPAQLFFIGPRNELVTNIFEEEGIKVKKVFSGKIRRDSGWRSVINNFTDIFFKIPLGVIQSFFYIFFLSPDLIFCKGGYGTIPPVIAAKILQVPIFLHESDVVPGLANRYLSRFALEIFTSFPKTEFFPVKKILLVGNPVRRALLAPLSSEKIQKYLNLKKGKPVLLIMGGSQGSERINDLILQILPQLLSSFEVIHQCGKRNYQNLKIESDFLIPKQLKDFYQLFPFMSEMELSCAYYASDIIISRAGAGSIFEIAAAQKPSILIPLPEAAQNHQSKNAQLYSDFGCALVVEEENLKPNFFLQKVLSLLKSTALRENMKKRAEKFARPRAAEIISHYIIEFLKQ